MRKTVGLVDCAGYWQKSNMPSREIHHACKATELVEIRLFPADYAVANRGLFPKRVAEK
jgi:hypothetical protein